jgi:hypothetical protein
MYDLLFFIITFGVLSFPILYYLDSHIILYNNIKYIKVKYNKFRLLNNLVSTLRAPIGTIKHKNILKIIYISIIIILQSIYINICQYFNKSLKQINKNTYELTYVIRGNIYKIIIPLKFGPNDILLIFDENLNDITDIIMPYFGPCNNFHGNDYTPEFFNYNQFNIELSSGDNIIIEKNEKISFTISTFYITQFNKNIEQLNSTHPINSIKSSSLITELEID